MRFANLIRLPLGNRGATAVETALTLPIFLLLVLGGVDLGLWLLHSAQLMDGGARALRVLKAGPPLVVLGAGEQVFCTAAPVLGCAGQTLESADRLLSAAEAARGSLPTLPLSALLVQYRASDVSGGMGRTALCVTLVGVQHDFIFLHILPGLGRAALLRERVQCDFLPVEAYRAGPVRAE